MKITDFLRDKAISVELQAKDKEGVIREMVQLLVKAGEIKPADEEKIVPVLLAREALGSTGIGQGVGIPHGKSNVVRQLVGAFGISRRGVNFDSLDGETAQIFFLLLAPEDSAGPHLKALARISRLLRDPLAIEKLRATRDRAALYAVLTEPMASHAA